MSPDTLNAEQRALIAAACARRAKRAQVEHYQQQARLAATPDYYEHMERRQYMVYVPLRPAPRMTVQPLGYSPYDNNWQAYLRAAIG